MTYHESYDTRTGQFDGGRIRRGAGQLGHSLGQGSRRIAAGGAEAARAHPVPTALLGLGLGWLAVSLSTGKDVRLPDRDRLVALNERARGAAQRARRRANAMAAEARSGSGRVSEEALNRARMTAERAEQRARRRAAALRDQAIEAEHRAADFAGNHPFVVSGLAFGLGAAVGSLLPRLLANGQGVASGSPQGTAGYAEEAEEEDDEDGALAYAEEELQGEGDYRAAHHYRDATEAFVREDDPERRAEEAARARSQDPESFKKAEAAGRKAAAGNSKSV